MPPGCCNYMTLGAQPPVPAKAGCTMTLAVRGAFHVYTSFYGLMTTVRPMSAALPGSLTRMLVGEKIMFHQRADEQGQGTKH